MFLLRSIFGMDVSSQVMFTILRLVMFGLSFVLEDWALHELFDSRAQRRTAILLVASSYVTWTWQVHTFSNAIETVLVLWCLVLVKRMEKTSAAQSVFLPCAVLASLIVFGIFNRITFPAFVVVPLLRLLREVFRRPSILAIMPAFAVVTAMVAIFVDTSFYSQGPVTISSVLRDPVITPLNSLRYNTQSSNLALHGTHPFYQHALINLPQLLGPAFLLLTIGHVWISTPLISALLGTGILSIFPHQEARFLLPAVPLILSSIRLPRRLTITWVGTWIAFNLALGVLMGVYHQGGVGPAQIHLSTQTNVTQAFWWKTYSPPLWLLGARSEQVRTVDLMGLDKASLQDRICMIPANGSVLIAPWSATFLDQFIRDQTSSEAMQLEELWRYDRHLNLDDLDFGDDGILPTLKRVVGRRSIVVWSVKCPQTPELPSMQRDW